MVRRLILLALAVCAASTPASVAWAMGCTAGGGLKTICTKVEEPVTTKSPPPDVDPGGEWLDEGAICEEGGSAICSIYQVCSDGSGYEHTYTYVKADGETGTSWVGCPSDAPAAPVLTPAAIQAAWDQAKPGPASMAVAPPGGETLVNFETIFSTDAAPFDYGPVSLAGYQVLYRTTPASYVWSFGDGDSLHTTVPGVPYESGRPMSDYVSHKYQLPAKDLTPTLTITWTGTFSVNGGRWQPLKGAKVTKIDGEPLDVLEAAPVLTE